MPNASAVQRRHHGREPQHAAINRRILKPHDTARRERHDRHGSPNVRRRRRERSERGKQQALSHQLANDAAAAGAERCADGELALALHAARQQQAGDVGAADGEHEQSRRRT